MMNEGLLNDSDLDCASGGLGWFAGGVVYDVVKGLVLAAVDATINPSADPYNNGNMEGM
jgi:hypothetical protein